VAAGLQMLSYVNVRFSMRYWDTLFWIILCCVALCCVALCCVVLRCTAHTSESDANMEFLQQMPGIYPPNNKSLHTHYLWWPARTIFPEYMGAHFVSALLLVVLMHSVGNSLVCCCFCCFIAVIGNHVVVVCWYAIPCLCHAVSV
jgi:hypothetical protein